jgi:hypothetical protein
MAVSDAMKWAMANGMTEDDVYSNIRDFLATSPDAATTQAAMAQYGISGEDVANATGGTSGGLLGGNILAGASWNSSNTALQDLLTETTGEATSNYAVAGSTTADTLNQLNTYLAGGGQFDSDATVFLQAGGVDFIQGVDREVVKDNLNQIVKTLADQGVNVVLTGSPYAASVEDVVNNNFSPEVDQIYNDVAKANSNVALVGTQGEILQNKALLVDALHTNAEGTSLYNQSVIDSLSQFKNEVPSNTPQDIAQVQKTNTVVAPPPVITQAAANPVVAQSLFAQIQAPEVDYYAQQFAPDVYGTPVTQSLATQSVDSLIAAGNLNPTQISAATGVPVGQIITQAAALAPIQGSIRLGDTYVSPNYEIIGSGEDQTVGGLQSIGTSKVSSEVGSRTEAYSPSGELTNVGTYEKGPSFFGGLAKAFNDPFVQAAFLGLGGGGALGNALGLTGSTAQAVGTGLFKGGAAAAGGADIEDALKVGLLSGGLVYGGNALNNYLTTGSSADVGITERQFAIQDAKQLADQGLNATQIRDTLSSGGYNDITVERALASITTPATITPVAVSTPVTDGVTITGQAPTSLNNVINTIAAAPVAVSTPVTDGGTVKVTGTTQPQMTTQQAVDLINSQIAANVTTPANLANVQVTAPKTTTTQDVINTIAATLPALTTIPTQTITAPSNTATTQNLINTIAATLPATVAAPTVKTPTTPEVTVTTARPVTTPETINTIASTLTPTAVTPTSTTTTPTKETDPLRVAQLALAAAGLLGAGSALSNTGTGTQFPIVPIPEGWRTPPPTGVAPFTPLPPINFGDRNLLIGTQWEKFLDPNYGKVPAPVQYSRPSSLSYNDLMGILGSRQGMPPASSLSINDIISGIQNQYGQAPVSTMG